MVVVVDIIVVVIVAVAIVVGIVVVPINTLLPLFIVAVDFGAIEITVFSQ